MRKGCKVMRMMWYEAWARSRLKRGRTSYLLTAHPFRNAAGLLGLPPQAPRRDAARLRQADLGQHNAQPATKRNAGGGDDELGLRGLRPYARVLA